MNLQYKNWNIWNIRSWFTKFKQKNVIDQIITTEQGKNGFILDELNEAQCGTTTIIYGQNKIRKKYVELELGKKGLVILGSKETCRWVWNSIYNIVIRQQQSKAYYKRIRHIYFQAKTWYSNYYTPQEWSNTYKGANSGFL